MQQENNNTATTTTTTPTSTTNATQTQTTRPTHQPSSFPFLIVTGLLFYFFSKSPTSSDSHSRNQLTRALQQRQLELIGLKQFLNLTSPTQNTNPHSNSNSSLVQPIPITPQIAYPPSNTFGTQSIKHGQQFISKWYQEFQSLTNDPPPYLYWNNITGHLKGNWRVHPQSYQWYPSTNNSSLFHSQRGKFNWLPSTNHSNIPLEINSSAAFPSTQKIGFNLRESHREQVRLNSSILRGSMYISSINSKDVVLDVEGVHFHDEGRFYLRGIPNQGYLDTRLHLSSALDIPASSSIITNSSNNNNDTVFLNVTTTSSSYQQIRIGHAILSDFENRIQRIQQILKKSEFSHDNNDDRDSNEEEQRTNCTFLIYASMKPLEGYSKERKDYLEEYERSLIEPTGASHKLKPTRPKFKSLLISPNCGLILESNQIEILISPFIRNKGFAYSLAAALIAAFQCWLLVWQMDSRQSPSSLSRMSYLTIVSQIIMDAWMFSSHLTLAVITNNNLSTQVLLIPAFFACLNGILFGMRYSTLIRLHMPSSNTTTTTTATIGGGGGITGDGGNNDRSTLGIGGDSDYVQVPNLPIDNLATTTPASTIPSTTSTTTISNQSRFILWFSRIKNFFTNRPLVSLTFLGLSFFIIPFFIYSWQPLMLTILYSYWIPQIIHNVQHGTSRRGLRKRFVLGTTLSRLFLPLYIWGCPKNVLFVDVKPWIWIISIYSITQAIIIVLQDYLGTRFFLYGGIFKYEAGWDYHPIKLPTSNNNNNYHLNDNDNGDGDDDDDLEGKKNFRECVICFEPLSSSSTTTTNDPPTDSSSSPPLSSTFNFRSFSSSFKNHNQNNTNNSNGVGGVKDRHHSLFSRWSVMVPPCLHIAHTRCLENWLAIKSECPVCRRPLPPI